MLQFNHVSKRYSDAGEVLVDVNFAMAPGEMAFLTGHSGAGKSTLLKLIALIERPSRGHVLLDNQNLSRVTESQIPFLRRKLGLIFQDCRLLHDRTVFDNVALPLIVAGYAHREVERRVRGALDKLGLLNKERRFPQALSGGEQQRVGIARAIVHKPSVILADEPTGNVDPELSFEIMKLFAEFNNVGVTVLIASHDIALIRNLGYPIFRLEQGRVAHGL